MRAEYSVFADTVVDMTWPQVEAAAARGAIALLPVGVVEQHGPHLPLGTDVYGAHLLCRLVRARLAEAGVEAVIGPPCPFGFNGISTAWPGTVAVRPEIVQGLLEDVVASLLRDGFEHVLLVNHHAERAHLELVLDVVRAQRAAGHAGVRWLEGEGMIERLGGDPDDPAWLRYPEAGEVRPEHMSGVLGVHAHEVETALMVRFFPELVDHEALGRLEPTRLGPGDLEEWRRGPEHARRVTPDGYFGAPKPVDAETWRIYERRAVAMADAVRGALGGS